LFHTERKGKANAINFAVSNSKYNIIVTLDADSKIDKNSLIEIVRPFKDKEVGAVSGIIRAIDNNNILTWFQDFEYMLSSGWRFICNKINSTYIFPGFAAFRKGAIESVGGFSPDTLSEDFEIGLKLKKKRYKLVMSNARIYTLVPQTIKGLIKQRLRWGRGTIQVIKKHRDIPFNLKYGGVGLYGIPTQIFWFIHGTLYIPIVTYQIFGGYIQYYISNNNFLTFEVLRYFFSWFSVYGMIEYTIRTFTGEYPLNPLFYLLFGIFCLYITYNLLIMLEFSELKLKYLFVVFFFFPYSLFVLALHVLPAIHELLHIGFKNAKMKSVINVWEKSI